MLLFRAVLVVVSAFCLVIAAGLAATLLWWAPWPPSDLVSDIKPWAFVAALVLGAMLSGGAAARLADRRARVHLAELLPDPMNNDG